MLLGFISLLLTLSTTYVVKICIPIKLGNTLLPCQHHNKDRGNYDDNKGDDRRKLLSYAEAMMWHRGLAAGDEKQDYCAAKGRISLISYKGVHQLDICIFVLVVFHVLYSVILMALGQAKEKLKGYDNIKYTPSRDRQWHLYTVFDKAVPIQRMFLRTLIRQPTTNDSFMVYQGLETGTTQSVWALPFTSRSILRFLMTAMEELELRVHNATLNLTMLICTSISYASSK